MTDANQERQPADDDLDAAYLKAQDAAVAPGIAERIADRLEAALEKVGRTVREETER